MKKLNYITVLGLAAGLTFAGNAMAEGGISPGKNAAFTIQNSGNAKGTAFTALDDATLTIARIDNPHGMNFEYGYYTYVNGTRTLNPLGTVEQSQTEPILLDHALDFKKGDMVGLYIKEIKEQQSPSTYTYYYTDTTVPKDTQLRTTTDNGHSAEYDAIAYSGKNKNDFGVKIYVNGKGTGSEVELSGISGGPLPGVWATIALAGAASAYLKRRRKENK